MGQYRKKPIVIEAVRFDGIREVDGIKTALFEDQLEDLPKWLAAAMATDEGTVGSVFRGIGGELVIVTLEGDHIASPGDWIIRGTAGELYPCKPDIFRTIYDPVDAAAATAFYDRISGSAYIDCHTEAGVGRTTLGNGAE